MRLQNSRLLSIVIGSVAILIIAACGKDNFTTKPQLTFLKAEDYDVDRGGLIEMKLEFTDAEGDLQDSIYIQRVVPRCTQSNQTIGYPMPAFPTTKDVKGEIDITFVNGVFLPGYVAIPSPACGRPDTTTFRFWIKDKAKNVSDTVTTDKPIIIQN
jgi:hypothetical protein